MPTSMPRFGMLPILLWLLLASSPSGQACALADSESSAEPPAHADCPLHTAPDSGSARHQNPRPPVMPQEAGQDTFAALAEMQLLLDSDPSTDWSRVDLDAFREHLVDMSRIALEAEVEVHPIPRGFRARVRGTGRTWEAIRRILPVHAAFIDGRDGLSVTVSSLAESSVGDPGIEIRVTTGDPSQVDRLRGLGFFGFLAAGDHHRHHHLAMVFGQGHGSTR